jgi:mycofactocin precursor
MSKQAVLEPAPAQTTEPLGPQAAPPEDGARRVGDQALIADELLVEEVSIDGMCGVY